jgi:hypothetical protein
LLVVSASAATISCNGGTTTIIASGSGGTPGYTYSTNGKLFQVSPAFSGAGAGSYTITVKDASGCTATRLLTIIEPPSLALDLPTRPTPVMPVECFKKQACHS